VIKKEKKGEVMIQEAGKQIDKNLAWFKLADLIARGEREKALNVFRLLSHSLSDRAYVLQVEGDILWYLDDKMSMERYKQAAFLYQKEKRWVDAISIYEHILTQNTQSKDILFTLMVFYTMIDWQDRLAERFAQLVAISSDDQLEKYLIELVSIVKEAADEPKNKWFFSWIKVALEAVPRAVSERIESRL